MKTFPCIKLQMSLVFALFLSTAAFAGPKDSSNLKLKVDLSQLKLNPEKIYFSYYDESAAKRVSDSVVLSGNRTAEFKVTLKEPLLAQLKIAPAVPVGDTGKIYKPTYPRDYLSIYVEPGVISVQTKDSLSNSVVKGSKSNTAYLELQKEVDKYDDIFDPLYKSYSEERKNKNNAALERIEKSIDSVQEIVNQKVYKTFIEKNKNSAVALYALNQYAGYSIDPKKVEPLFSQLDLKLRSYPSAQSLEEKIELSKKLQVGQQALPFSQNDTSGNKVDLSSFAGKYVLIDFWASWCGPCRVENPNVVKAFQKYKDKGFTVLGISLDREGQQDKWLKAIHDDNLTWTHVSDLKFWDNEVAKLYGIQAIPQNYLLGPDQKIVAKNIRGEDLEKTLDEVLK